MQHLKGFGLENFRVFKDYTWFDFAPITLLIGPNSSGKSSLNKGLLLAKDNYDKGNLLATVIDNNSSFLEDKKKSINPYNGIDFSNPNHGLLSIERIYTDNSNKKYFSIELPYILRFLPTIDDNLRAKIRITYGESYRGETKVNNFPINVAIYVEDLLLLSYGLLTEKTKFYFDAELFFYLFDESFDFEKKYYSGDSTGNAMLHFFLLKEFGKNIFEETISLRPIKTETKNVQEEINNFLKKIEALQSKAKDLDKFIDVVVTESTFGGGDEEFEYEEHKSLTETIRKQLALTKFEEKYIQKVLGYVPLGVAQVYIPNGLIDIFSFETKYFGFDKPFYYLPTSKGTLRRTYNSYDDNVLSKLIIEYHKNRTQYFYEGFLDKWAKNFKIQNDVEIINQTDLDVLSIKANDKPLVELGYGISQITTLLMAIQVQNKDSIIILEEPEANLHPAFQSKLADMFYDAHKTFNQQFIIETHSEYMVRKFQYLVAKGEMKKEDIVIYYFNDPNSIPAGEPQVKKIEILEDGSLSDDFGSGFFDEADNLAINLFNLQNRKN